MAAPMKPPASAPEFLARAGWGGAEILPLAGDASFRRYFRIIAPGRHAVLMDAPPPHEDTRPFLYMAAHLASIGFPAPSVFAEDKTLGLVLLEDFGDRRMREVLDGSPNEEQAIYRDVVALLARLHRHPPADLPPYSHAELHREAMLFPVWYCPALELAVEVDSYSKAWDAAFAALGGGGQMVTVLRDYHSENIMLLDGGRLGLLDFQDALAGHPAYDLVSLLQDARRDVTPELEAEMRHLYTEQAGSLPDFDDAYAVLGAQRNTKILGIFARLWKRDGKPLYLKYMARVWGYLERDLTHPALAEVAAWFDANVLKANRAEAWTGYSE